MHGRRHITNFQGNFQATLDCDIVLMALTSFVLPSTEHVAVFFFCLLRVLEVFGLYATLIFSLIIIIIITIAARQKCEVGLQ